MFTCLLLCVCVSFCVSKEMPRIQIGKESQGKWLGQRQWGKL